MEIGNPFLSSIKERYIPSGREKTRHWETVLTCKFLERLLLREYMTIHTILSSSPEYSEDMHTKFPSYYPLHLNIVRTCTQNCKVLPSKRHKRKKKEKTDVIKSSIEINQQTLLHITPISPQANSRKELNEEMWEVFLITPIPNSFNS